MRAIGQWARTLGIGVVVFLLFGVVVGVAGAQRPDGGPAGPRPGAGPDGPRGELREEFVTRLAANLGLPEETVRQALEQTREEMRPIVRERMEQARQDLRERFQDPAFQERWRELRERFGERFRDGEGPRPFNRPGMPPGPGGQGRFGPGGPAPFNPGGGPPMNPGGQPMNPGGVGLVGPDFLRLSAEILNVDPAALRQELQEGKTMAQIAQEHGVPASALADQLAARLEQQRQQQTRDFIERAINQPLPIPGPRGPDSQP
jgi:hypothetical protein